MFVYIVILIILLILIAFMLLVFMGNLSAMKFLAKHGVAVFCGDISKDFALLNYVNPDGVAWLKVPNVCYAPVMLNKKGYYRKHNFLKKENSHGELYLSSSRTANVLKKFSHNEGRGVCDLCMITGSPYSAGNSLRHSNFSNLRSYVNMTKNGSADDVEVKDNKGVRRFRLAFAVDITRGSKHTTFSVDSRDTILKGLRSNNIVYDSKSYDFSKDVLILRYYTDIDNLTLVLYEV